MEKDEEKKVESTLKDTNSEASEASEEAQKEVETIDEIKNETLDLETDSSEVRITTIGNVDSGKSTLIGCLSKGVLDDGRGFARGLVFNFGHEKESGRTSSIAHEIMGFSESKQITPKRYMDKKTAQWSEVYDRSDKIINLIDLCGHEKYLKTTIFGLSGLFPDYAMIIVGANMGVQRMTREHLGVSLALNLPFVIVITKVDVPHEDVYKKTLNNILTILKSRGVNKKPVVVKENDDGLESYANSLSNGLVTPIFSVSAVKGQGMPELTEFISHLPPRNNMLQFFKTEDKKIEMLIDSAYNVSQTGLVIAGTVTNGTVKVGQTLWMGPDKLCRFKELVVKSIHYKRVEVDSVSAGKSCCFSIKSADKKDPIKREFVRKGMVALDKDASKECCKRFTAEVLILHHAAQIKKNYQAVIHCGVIRQSARVVEMDKEILRTGDKGVITFEFITTPEYMHLKTPILFREGRTRGLGKVTEIFPIEGDYEPPKYKNKKPKK